MPKVCIFAICHDVPLGSNCQGFTDLLYYKAYAALKPSAQRIFYGKKEGDEFKFYRGTNDNRPPGLGEMHIDHRLEIQRMKNLFKREKPEDVTAEAWEKMQIATAENTNSVSVHQDAPTKDTI